MNANNNKHTKWEYKQVGANFADLNALGGEGWELCNFININGLNYYTFKRPKIEVVGNAVGGNAVKHESKLIATINPLSIKVGDWVIFNEKTHGWKHSYQVAKIVNDYAYLHTNGGISYVHYYLRNLRVCNENDFIKFPKEETHLKGKKIEPLLIKVGDWIVALFKDGEIKWPESYLVSKITEDKIYVWYDGKEHFYSIKESVFGDAPAFKVAPINHPKCKGSYNPNEKKVKKVNPSNPKNIRKGDWVAINKDTSGSRAYGAYKVHSVKDGNLTIIYDGKPHFSWKDYLKTVHKVTKEEAHFYRKIF